MNQMEILDLENLMSEHPEVNKLETVAESSNVVFDDSLEEFLLDTQSDINLLPESDEEQPVEPFLYVDRLTANEIDVYKKDHLFVRHSRECNGEIQLCIMLDGEFVVLGWVKAELRTFLLIKKLCEARDIYICAGGERQKVLVSHLSHYLLEEA